MDLQTQLANELKKSMLARDTVKTSTLRMLISAIRNKEIEKKKPFADGDVLEVIGAEAKRRRESMEEYQKAGRQDLADKEESELKVLQSYLPQPMSSQVLQSLVEETIRSVGAKSPQDMGRVMSALMPQIKGRADGKQAQQIVQQLLKP